ncbi:unnamed protein product [Urochloa decumbens]|uniref:F-box domain-containing protein n=1 Tax=Urochloa decumbens TaxID=240449 RepID=A0ABC8VZD2_9POAL
MDPPPPARRRRGAEDRISSLPDELLHLILLRLPSIAEAARTSVLSRRWRPVWTHMPELVLPAPATTSPANLDSIDAVLRSSYAPSLHALKIDVSNIGQCHIPSHRVASWLSFASERLAGKLDVDLPWPSDSHLPRLRLDHLGQFVREMEEELALPLFERATEIDIDLGMNFFLRPPPVGSFAALTCLTITCAHMDGGELGRIVSSAQCPRLRKLWLSIIELVAACDVTICSGSLEYLYYSASETIKLEVTAPMLLEILVSDPKEAYIVAPKLEKVDWKGKCYDPGRHKFAVAPRHLRSLKIMYSTYFSTLISSTGLRQRFDAANELMVSLALLDGIEGYVNFLTDMDKLPACETLIIHLFRNNHAFAPIMLHLLRRCRCIRKLKLHSDWRIPPETGPCSTSGCPCLLPESYGMDGCTFDALEEIEISLFTGSTEEEEFVKLLLSRCNMVTLKSVGLTVPFVPVTSEIMEVVEGIRAICCPNTKVQFNVRSREVPKPSF